MVAAALSPNFGDLLMAKIVSLCLPPLPINLHFDHVDLARDSLTTMHVAVATCWDVLNKVEKFGGDASALRVVRDLFAGVAYRLDELAGISPVAEAGD